MGRLLVFIFCLLAPIGVYLIWITLVRRKQQLAAEGQLEPWRALPCRTSRWPPWLWPACSARRCMFC